MKNKKMHNHVELFGTSTIGERGQVVIPAKARKMLKLTKGDKVLVFGSERGVITFVKLDEAKEFMGALYENLKNIIKADVKK